MKSRPFWFSNDKNTLLPFLMFLHSRGHTAATLFKPLSADPDLSPSNLDISLRSPT